MHCNALVPAVQATTGFFELLGVSAARGRTFRPDEALAGGALGLLLSRAGTRLLVLVLAKAFAVPRIENTHVDLWVLGFTLVLSLATGIVFGVVPAFTAASPTRVTKVPGVRSAALVANLPLGGGEDSLGFHIPGRPDPAPVKAWSAAFNIISPGYFHTMAIPLRAGREFTEQDVGGAPGVIVINETAARQLWPGEDPLGKQIDLPADAKTSITLTVVGVTGDVRQIGLGIPPRPEVFLDYLQPGPPWPWPRWGSTASCPTRSRSGPGDSPGPGGGARRRDPSRLGRGAPSRPGRIRDRPCGTVAVTRLLTNLVPGVQPGDPLTLSAVSALLIGVALAASYLPARRASRVDPVIALRYE